MAVSHVWETSLMSVNFASASQQIEWLDLATVERILQVTREDIRVLVESGVLSARGERISSGSLDKYTASRPLFGQPSPPTYVRHGNGYRLEV
jgi:hypothetical protein